MSNVTTNEKKILSDLTVYLKYAKFIPEKNRRETWDEIVDRYQDMMVKKYPSLVFEIVENIKLIRDKRILPSMRALQFAGKPIEVNHCRSYNCCYLPIDDPKAFSEVIFLLLGGTGVGFSVRNHHISQLPPIKKPKGQKRYLVGDSIEGWADAIKMLMKSYFGQSSVEPSFDFSDIRPKGAQLITAGGKAPGPEPLRLCIERIKRIIDKRQDGEKLGSLECHDIINHLADAVLAGGIRRSACISLFDMDDEDMLTCKAGAWWEENEQRGRSNNSAVLYRDEITKDQFFSIWKKIQDSGSGEPGVFLSNDKESGTNPSLRKGTKVLTTEGIFPIEELQDKEFFVKNLDGKISRANCWLSGKDKPLFKLKLKGGHEYFATAEHQWPVWDGDKYVKVNTPNVKIGSYLPVIKEDKLFDGELGTRKEGWQVGARIYRRQQTDIHWTKSSEEFRKGYIAAVFDLFAHVDIALDKGTISIMCSSEQMSTDLSELLGFYGINTTIDQDGYRRTLKITEKSSITHLLNLCPFGSKDIGKLIQTYFLLPKSENSQIEVIGIEKTELEEDVWDITVHDETHCFQIAHCITGNCCEVRLKPFSFCNLTEINATTIMSEEDFQHRAKVAAFFGTLQAGFTDFHYLRDIWKKTTEEDALIGVGITGIASGTILNYNLIVAAKVVTDENIRVAHKIGIAEAARKLVVKPAGTTSLVCSTSSGIHAWHSEFYIRRIRVGKDEPIYQYFKDKLPTLIEQDQFKESQGIICIPQAAPLTAITRSESTFELLERIKKFNIEWVQEGFDRGPDHNNVSATVSVKDDEWKEVGEWMWENRENYAGLSVLPYDNGSYVQAPFEVIDEATFHTMMEQLVAIDLTEIVEYVDVTDLRGEAACTGADGGCEVR